MTQHRKTSQLVNFLAIGWALSLLGIESSIAPHPAFAQSRIVPDTTLGTENSILTSDPSGLIDIITGGAIRGQNLFHSFQEFNVGHGTGTYFVPNNNAIQNIFARVTANNVSEILGTLGVFGSTANLFLMNPNGIIFGENARLDVSGSFVATTANAIGFGNQGFFSASVPNNPSPLLTINPTAFLFNQVPKGAIVNRAFGSELSNIPDILDNIEELTGGLIDEIPGGLTVQNGKSVILLGGDVNLDGGEVGAFGGRVEVGGLSAPGTVRLNIDGSNFSLQFPQGIPRANVNLHNGATIYNFLFGGNIAINARNLNLYEGSQIGSVLLFGSNGLNPANEVININATESVNLQDESIIANVIFSGNFNNGGNVQITTESLNLRNESTIGSIILGGTFNNGGNIQIKTGSLNLKNSGLNIFSAGQGTLGSVIVEARDQITIDGEFNNTASENNIFQSFSEETDTTSVAGILVNLLPGAVGQGGDIRISTGSLRVTNGALLNTTTLGSGNSGDIIIQAKDNITFDGSDSGIGSFVIPRALLNSQGNGGDVKITTGSLNLTNGGVINTSTFGIGDAGSITINARNTVTIDGQGNDLNASRILSFVGPIELETEGNGGNVEITTGSLRVTNGGQIDTSTLGRGNGGNITIKAQNTVIIDNQSAVGSIVGTNVASTYKGGDVQITADSLFLNNNALIGSITIGQGKAGNVNVQVNNSFTANNSGVVGGFTFGSGDAGNVTIKANNNVSFDNSSGVITGIVALSDIINRFGTSDIDEGVLDSISSNVGAAGDIDISARTIKLDNISSLSTLTTSGDGGDIRLQAQDFLLLRRGSSITAQAGVFGDGGNGGNVTINTPFLLSVAGENTDIVANAFSGNGGRVEINAQGIFGLQVLSRAEIERLLNNAEVFSADQLPTNDIVVFSQTNPTLDGEVTLNTPDVDPTQGLVDLPTNVVDTSGLVNQSCVAFNDETGNQFTITGRGGLPASPEESLSSDVVWSDTRLTVATKPQPNSATPVTQKQPTAADHVAIVPASGWVRDRQGKVTLVSHSANLSPSSVGYRSTSCQVP